MLFRYIIFMITVFGLSACASKSAPSNATIVKQPAQEELTTVTDGPYIFVENHQAERDLSAFWLCQGEVINKQIKVAHFPITTSACDLPAKVHSFTSLETNVLEYSGDFKVAALSDFHGQYDLMIELLTNNRIIDEQKNWLFGNGHFVITGDIFDRGDKVTEILWFLYDLERQAEQSGGKVHLTLANHEVMILNGDLRYLHPKYIETAQKLNKPFEALFSKTSILGNWLRSKPVLVKVNNMLFTHGGFHPSLASNNHSLEEINSVFKNSLVKAELAQPRQGFSEYLHGSNGPIWYRGYFTQDRNKTPQGKGSKSKATGPKDKGATSAEIDFLLKHFDVDHLIVGHTSQKQIETRYQGRVIAIDSSIKSGKYGEVLFVEKGQMWRGSLTGDKLPLTN
ncbi:metallophosphoesterase [Colwellia psychrerythraea]|uniref:Metallophosphoesterase n=1 Tax=Colwellia psychrerythraea TaxID=28229 RepID=A0A099KE61_COLPS|nr:metallophosphoesterase [Colwellia psychrerythraea]KGJ88322.1 metallophosphoesterase [Colwellia psychrerythraea]